MSTVKPKKVTKKRLDAVTREQTTDGSRGVHNSYGIAALGLADDRCIWIDYTPASTGRASRMAHSSICSTKFKTDPKAHWQNYGSKTFTLDRKVWLEDDPTKPFAKRVVREPIADARQRLLDQCIAWAAAKYDLPTEGWEKDPFGGWHPPGTMAALDAWLQERGI